MVTRACISINNRCNLNCTYCHFHEKKDYIQEDNMDVITILDIITSHIEDNDIDLFKLGFVGNGEPMLDYEKLKQYIAHIGDYLKSGRIAAYTITNGLLVDCEKLEFFKEYNVNVGFSVDGISAIHDKYRCGTHERVMENIALYKEVNGKYPSMNCTVGKEIIDNPEATIGFFEQFGNRITFSRMIGKQGISLSDFNAFLNKAMERLNVRTGGYDCTMYGGMCGAGITINNEVYDIVASNNYVVLSSGIKDLWSDIANAKNLGTIFASPYISADVKYYVVKQLREHGYTIFAYGDSKIDLYMLREADKGFLYIGKQISRSLKNESLSGLVPIYDHSLVILADEDEEVQADIAICKSNSGISGSRLAAAHVRLGEKIGRHIATVFPEKNTSILVLERGGRFFGDGVYMGAGGIFYSMNPKQDDAPVINTERVVIVDSVINTGKSIMRIIDELKNHNPGIDVIIAANVIQNEAAELFKDYLVFATRLSKNSFVGVNQSKQTGKTGPDTADRLFNLIKKRY